MAALLKRLLEEEGHAVDVASSGPETVAYALQGGYSVVIVEQLLPVMDAVAVCARMRARRSRTPVLMLCSETSVMIRAAAMEAGVGDYLVKPFAFDELFERMAAVAHRTGPYRDAQLRAGDLRMDSRSRRAWRGDVELDLSSREFALLRQFVSNPGVVLSRARILERVWSYEHGLGSNVVDQYVLHLRRKIDRPFRVSQLETVRGIGYRLHEQPVPMRRPERALGAG